jgi:CRISPR-associated protein Csx16
MFGSIVEAIRTCKDSVLLDITHGFRSQPFFAAACIQYVQSVLPNPPRIQVVYAEYRETEPESPIWELTPFLEVLSWSRNLMIFLRTGQAGEVVKATESFGRELDRQLPKEGAQLRKFATALGEFSNDFTTIRTGSMLTGKKASAQGLDENIYQTREEVAQKLPALKYVLDQAHEMVEPLRTNGARLSSTAGQRVLVNLAKLYQSLGRYGEACSIIREGWITLGAPENADEPGPNFDKKSRSDQESRWHDTVKDDAREVGNIRNDILHAGFNDSPKKRKFNEQITTMLAKWEAAIDASEGGSPEDVSNHVKLSQS